MPVSRPEHGHWTARMGVYHGKRQAHHLVTSTSGQAAQEKSALDRRGCISACTGVQRCTGPRHTHTHTENPYTAQTNPILRLSFRSSTAAGVPREPGSLTVPREPGSLTVPREPGSLTGICPLQPPSGMPASSPIRHASLFPHQACQPLPPSGMPTSFSNRHVLSSPYQACQLMPT